LDPRLRILPLPNGRVMCMGRSFPNAEKAVEWATEAIKRREELAGRELTANELVVGVKHANDLTLRQKVDAANREIPMANRPREADPFGDPIHLQTKGPGGPSQYFDGPSNREELVEAARETYLRRVHPEAIEQEILDAREYSLYLYERALFDESQPQSVVDQAEWLKQVAWTDGADLKAFKKLAGEFVVARQAEYEAQKAQLELERAQADARLASLRGPVAPMSEPTTTSDAQPASETQEQQ